MSDAQVARAAEGLTTAEACERLKRYGPNAVAEERPHPLMLFVRKLWGPVPWLLEAAIGLAKAAKTAARKKPAKVNPKPQKAAAKTRTQPVKSTKSKPKARPAAKAKPAKAAVAKTKAKPAKKPARGKK